MNNSNYGEYENEYLDENEYKNVDLPSEEEQEELRERVQSGVELFNKKVPEWRNLIDWHIFDFNDIINCVVGQLIGHGWEFDYSSSIGTDLGNVCEDSDVEVAFLHNEWIRQGELK